ncbi:hypothetical protein CVT24_010587 [Panaeolus cyanescens]|uniref:BZIP domain-containing protein n=1 Tax=Panaeolus cyanescens TaxID=181874 RepID=A0A409WEG1_9AGAR|nr:hypothetical protein CVT24_010587 [Panaeolus cyanescens]
MNESKKTPTKDRKKYKDQYYAKNIDMERYKARERARKLKSSQTPEEALSRRERHREAQARYRSQNKVQLRTRAWNYRRKKAYEDSIARDEAEYQRLMTMDDDD